MKMNTNVWIVLLLTVFTGVAAGCKNSTHDTKSGSVVSATEVVSKSALLATIAADEGAVSAESSSKHSAEAKAEKEKGLIVVEMNRNGRGVAYIAQVGDKVRVVHNDKRGKLYDSVETFSLTVSPDGQRVAYGAQSNKQWYIVIDGRESGPFSEIGKPTFSADSRMVAYEAKRAEIWNVYLGNIKSAEIVSLFNYPVFNRSADKLFWVENTKNENEFNYIISDKAFKKIYKKVLHSTLYVTSADNELVAAVDKEGDKSRVVEFSLSKPDDVKNGQLYDEIRNLVYSTDGKGLSYYAAKGNKKFVVLNGKEELLPEGTYPSSPVIRSDNGAIGMVIAGDDWAYVHQAFNGNVSKGIRYKECADIAYSNDSKHIAYVAIKGDKFLIVANGLDGPQYDRVISPKFSPDGKFLVYRARQDGKRFVVVADAASGKVLRESPRYERVFETAFTPDGTSVAYGVVDGKQLWWKVEKL